MATATVIPLSPQPATGMARQHAMPLCTVLTPELATRLQQINQLSRRLRTAGVRVMAVQPLESSIRIEAEDSEQFSAAFNGEWRGVSWRSVGAFTLNSVHLDGCRVCWLTPARGQAT